MESVTLDLDNYLKLRDAVDNMESLMNARAARNRIFAKETSILLTYLLNAVPEVKPHIEEFNKTSTTSRIVAGTENGKPMLTLMPADAFKEKDHEEDDNTS